MSWGERLWQRIQSLGFFVFVLVVAFGLGLLFLPLLHRSHSMQQDMRRLDSEIERQEAVERQQHAEIDALKTDPSFLERTARSKLNLAKPNETVFKFEPQPSSVTANSTTSRPARATSRSH
ncbi:MAG: septum formation initiator family protein [Verrucomicrobiia bacterium]